MIYLLILPGMLLFPAIRPAWANENSNKAKNSQLEQKSSPQRLAPPLETAIPEPPALPSVAEKPPITAIPEADDLPPLSTQASDLMAQDAPADQKAQVVEVTGVTAQPTATGLEIKLEAADTLQISTQVEGTTLVTDIDNAVLALPNGQPFRQENPVAGITEITVTQVQPTRVQVRVTGVEAPPVVNTTSGAEGVVLAVTPEVGEEAETEITVTAEQEQEGYRVPDATTATKTDTPVRDVPQSTQVIPKEVLQDQQVTRLEEALRNVAGITVGGSNEGQGYFIGVRGFQGIPVLLDGFRQYPINGGESIVETANLEKIEILKGPASILYGEIQPGGVINLVTKKPLSDPFYGLELQVGNRNLFRPRIDFSGPLTKDGKLLYRLNALVSTEEPFRNFDTNFERLLVAPTLAWNISDRTDLTLQLEYFQNKQPGDFGRITDGDRVLRTPREFITGEPDDFTESNILNVGYNFEHRFNDNWKLRNALRYQSRGFFQELTFAFSPELDAGKLTRNFFGFDIDSESYSMQTNVVGKFKTGPIKHTLLVGVDLNRTTEVGVGGFDLTPLVLDIFNPVYGLSPRPDFNALLPFFGQENTQNRLGIYLQDQVDLLDNLKFLFGVRYDRVEQDIKNGETLFSPASEVNQTSDALSPRVGLVYQPLPELSLYASYSQSFNPNSGVDFDGNPFEPERGRGWEAGIKAELLDKKLFATLAYFDITRQNVVTADPINPFFSVATGEQRSRGVDLDISGQILPGWNVIGSYAYIDSAVLEDNTIPRGNRLDGIPTHSASLWTTYEIQKGSLKGLGAGFGFNVVGERFGDLENSFTLDPYILFDAAIFYKRDNWRWAVNFKNIGNVDYDDGTPFGNTRIGVGAPFTVIGSVSVEF
ncbi:MAG: TonB-dependent siderophore receptor [Acaryochloris sp. SU_5_25]|nr:TonB-dependent siderophore receptor [Acaryochloris sp. SU_5_25]